MFAAARSLQRPGACSSSGVAEEEYDCAVIGGGPAGSLAAIYLARFRRKVALIDAGHPRAR